jgi:hypothetical protein
VATCDESGEIGQKYELVPQILYAPLKVAMAEGHSEEVRVSERQRDTLWGEMWTTWILPYVGCVFLVKKCCDCLCDGHGGNSGCCCCLDSR